MGADVVKRSSRRGATAGASWGRIARGVEERGGLFAFSQSQTNAAVTINLKHERGHDFS